MNPTEKTARDLKKIGEEIYVPQHEFRIVEAKDFPHLDHHFYDSTRDMLIAQGFRHLGDIENLTLTKPLNMRTFLRILISADGKTVVSLYQPKPAIWVRILLWIFRMKVGKTMDCETELAEGQYIATSNAVEAAKLTPFPMVESKFFSYATPYESILAAHLARLRELPTAYPGREVTVMRTLEEVFAMQDRMQAAKAAFRKSIGHATTTELEKHGANPRTAREIKDAMDRLDS